MTAGGRRTPGAGGVAADGGERDSATGRARRQPAGPGHPPARRPEGGGRHPWRAISLAVAMIGLVAGVAWALLGSRFLIVRSVRVVGADSLVPRSRVLAAAKVPVGEPMIGVNAAAVQQRVEHIQQVASVVVSRDWPATVVITVRPRVPLFAVGKPGHYRLVDADGVTVRTSARSAPPLPVLTVSPSPGSSRLTGDPAVRAAAAVLEELPHSLVGQVRWLSAATSAGVSVGLANGTIIDWGQPGDAGQKSAELAVLMRTHAHVYDVSTPGVAVTKQ
jgi:cell division protein FtsQ